MADAGKVVITPKGKYSSTATYEWLDEVTYDGKAYVALKTVTGVTPSDDGVNWRLYLDPNDIIAGDLVPTFTEAIERSNIVSDESLSTILGKVKKYFTDLKGHAFNEPVNNLTTSTTGSALDASQGNVLQGEVDEINRNLDGLNQRVERVKKYIESDSFAGDQIYTIGSYDIKSGETIVVKGYTKRSIKGVAFRLYNGNTQIVSTEMDTSVGGYVYGKLKYKATSDMTVTVLADSTISADPYMTIYLSKIRVSIANGEYTIDDEIEEINASLGGYVFDASNIEQGNWHYDHPDEQNYSRSKRGTFLTSGTKAYVTNNTNMDLIITDYNGENFDANNIVHLTVGETRLFNVPSGHDYRWYTEERVDNTKEFASNIIISKSGISKSVANQNASLDSVKDALGGLKFSVDGGTLSITDGTKTWTLS